MASIVDVYNKTKSADRPPVHTIAEVADALTGDFSYGNAHVIADVLDTALSRAQDQESDDEGE